MLKELSSSEQLIEIAHDRLDLGFVHTTRVPPELSQILVASQAFVCCLPQGHALSRKRQLPLKMLEGQPFAVISRTASPDYHDRILASCADAGFKPEIRYELQHWLSVASLVAQGMGVALVPEALRQSRIAGAVFVPLAAASPSASGEPVNPAVSAYETHCLWKTGREDAALAAFVAAVRSASDGIKLVPSRKKVSKDSRLE
jgi:DNA-binding transcriptional LysR family regulator